MIVLTDEQEERLLSNIQKAVTDIQAQGRAYPDDVVPLLLNIEQFIKDESQSPITDQTDMNKSGRSVSLHTDDDPHVYMDGTTFYTETAQQANALYHALLTVVEVEDDQ